VKCSVAGSFGGLGQSKEAFQPEVVILLERREMPVKCVLVNRKATKGEWLPSGYVDL
jgi:hypothetical protein